MLDCYYTGAYQTLSIAEDATTGTLVGRLIGATDRDENDKIHYVILSEDGEANSNTFKIKGDKIAITKKLNREVQSRWVHSLKWCHKFVIIFTKPPAKRRSKKMTICLNISLS